MFPLLTVMKRERTIRKGPCLDLGTKQLRRVGEDGETAKGSKKETKPCRNCGDLLCPGWDAPAAGIKLSSVAYLCSLITSSKDRKALQLEGSW